METPLELLHLMRHRGLRQVQLLRRGGETATRDDLDSTVSMSNPTDRVEIITSVQRRRPLRRFDGTFEPGMTVSLVARWPPVAGDTLVPWSRRLRPLAPLGASGLAGSGYRADPHGRSWTKGSTWAVQSARSGHSHNIIMEPESRCVRGPGMCVQGVQGHCPEEGGVMDVEPP